MINNSWISLADKAPERGEVVETKIHDDKGERNIADLKRGAGNLWWFPDGSMYVYYSPTHWRKLNSQTSNK